MAPNKLFTLAEVSKHNTKEDLWLIIHDKVYDVTKFQLEVRLKSRGCWNELSIIHIYPYTASGR